MDRPHLLDLFCGAGGAAMGYYRAGFDVTGVDIEPQKHYPFNFIQADALTLPVEFLQEFDVIHASPPCQAFSIASYVRRHKEKKIYLDLLTPTRELLIRMKIPWVIENVIGSPMSRMIVLCGLMFDLRVFRHRSFESSVVLFAPAHISHRGKRIGEGYYCVAGNGGMWRVWGNAKGGICKGNLKQCQDAMGISWMSRRELTQAIPPAYCEFIGKQLIRVIESTRGKK